MIVIYAHRQEESEQDGLTSSAWDAIIEALLNGRARGGGHLADSRNGIEPADRTRNELTGLLYGHGVPSADWAAAGITDRPGFLRALRGELPSAIRKMQDAAVPALDLTQAALGPGLAVFSRFARVVEPSGEPMSVRTAIALINQVRSETLTELQDEFDADTRWAVQWFEEYGFAEGPYSRAEVLFTGTDTSFDGLRRAGIIDSRPSKVWLVRPDDLPDNWNPAADNRVPVWEVTMHLVRNLDRGGEEAAARTLAQVSGSRDAARDLAYRIADICERRRWAREALEFNGLIVSWPEIARQCRLRPRRLCCDSESAMALSNRERLGRAFELLAPALGSYVDRVMRARSESGQDWFGRWQERERGPVSLQDPSFQLKVLADSWEQVFRHELARADRNLVYELRDGRNRLAHNQPFTVDDTYRALDSMERLLAAIGAAEAPEVGRSKDELMRLRYETDAARSAARQEVLLASPRAGLKPWREVIAPHADVLRGRFSVAEFAADLYQVSLGRGSAEYADPVEFFARTYLTGGLRGLLTEAVRRLVHAEGIPVVNLQTTFGGGKTHSQIALWHLFSGTPVNDFPDDVQGLLADVGVTTDLPEVTRAALVGNKISPGQPSVKDDGTVVATLWGELAWQLGGREGYDLVGAADRTGTNPGANLDLLLERYSPCLILIDEWVGYARQLVSTDNLPAGSFDTQLSFVQALTEAARATPGALLVVSLPASIDAGRSGGGLDIELGGPGGREALRRLHAVVGRIESPWRPATSGESFEIVRRRLFKPLDPELLADRDATARAFGDMYRRESAEFPAECREVGYVERIKAAYPIHPELFARLYEDWSTLDRFQLTRGVLRLMADVIHALWEGGDQSPLILPASVPIAHPAVATELINNLGDNWQQIIDTDVDGPNSIPVQLDNQLPNLGRYQAARRIARTVFIGSAPGFRSPTRGIDAARVRLGCALPR